MAKFLTFTKWEICEAELHWYEANGKGKKEIKRKRYIGLIVVKEKNSQNYKFVVCINNSEYLTSLELHKTYRILPDKELEQDGDIRIIDESGEDYIYPADWFAAIDVPKEVKTSLVNAS